MSLKPSVVVPTRRPSTQKAEGPELKTRAEY